MEPHVHDETPPGPLERIEGFEKFIPFVVPMLALLLLLAAFLIEADVL